ncbi:hypothetical protein SEA_TUNATARTARE_259 [Streptomyces phage TunaTartare]|jgi:hypothetical protein|uniref:Uncharacterized protein n=1 Tax=Streptomyces phage TunaTartare TaxID=2848887 RepID=A0A8F2E7A9_9CAUD|nr:hypothetical protein PP457_gp021 [Streptomyces phage TunaTartare]QWT30121.1 hypothetical protein SEA_TUNATARTARE_259 [Streptomyces phage TunaTartare]
MRSSIIKFEIPEFGLAKFTPENLGRLLHVTKDMDAECIVRSLWNDGFGYSIQEWPELTRIEWIAIYGECHGYGEA